MSVALLPLSHPWPALTPDPCPDPPAEGPLHPPTHSLTSCGRAENVVGSHLVLPAVHGLSPVAAAGIYQWPGRPLEGAGAPPAGGRGADRA